MSKIKHLTIFLVSTGLSACASTQYTKPKELMFQKPTELRTEILEVFRDQKLCHDDTVDAQNCPTDFYIDDMKAASFYIDNTAQFYLKPETYNFKVKNCTDECAVCETEINPRDLKDSKIVISVDESGLPFMLNTENQMICETYPQKKAEATQPLMLVETTTQLNLAADTLFKFDRSSLNDLLPKGKLEVIDVANKITSKYAKVSQINLIGHTDRLGNDLYNLNLGEKRAQTVRQLLITHGVPANIIHAKSAGETTPVTDGCFAVTEREERKACLQPDRRVTVEITGISK